MSNSSVSDAADGVQYNINTARDGALHAANIAALKECANAHKGGWNIPLLLQQAQDEAVLAEAVVAVNHLPEGLATAGREVCDCFPEPLATFCLGLCACRKGNGGRNAGPNPLQDPTIPVEKALRILDKRHTAAVSKFRDKVIGLVEAALAAGTVPMDVGLAAAVCSKERATIKGVKMGSSNRRVLGRQLTAALGQSKATRPRRPHKSRTVLAAAAAAAAAGSLSSACDSDDGQEADSDSSTDNEFRQQPRSKQGRQPAKQQMQQQFQPQLFAGQLAGMQQGSHIAAAGQCALLPQPAVVDAAADALVMDVQQLQLVRSAQVNQSVPLQPPPVPPLVSTAWCVPKDKPAADSLAAELAGPELAGSVSWGSLFDDLGVPASPWLAEGIDLDLAAESPRAGAAPAAPALLEVAGTAPPSSDTAMLLDQQEGAALATATAANPAAAAHHAAAAAAAVGACTSSGRAAADVAADMAMPAAAASQQRHVALAGAGVFEGRNSPMGYAAGAAAVPVPVQPAAAAAAGYAPADSSSPASSGSSAGGSTHAGTPPNRTQLLAPVLGRVSQPAAGTARRALVGNFHPTELELQMVAQHRQQQQRQRRRRRHGALARGLQPQLPAPHFGAAPEAHGTANGPAAGPFVVTQPAAAAVAALPADMHGSSHHPASTVLQPGQGQYVDHMQLDAAATAAAAAAPATALGGPAAAGWQALVAGGGQHSLLDVLPALVAQGNSLQRQPTLSRLLGAMMLQQQQTQQLVAVLAAAALGADGGMPGDVMGRGDLLLDPLYLAGVGLPAVRAGAPCAPAAAAAASSDFGSRTAAPPARPYNTTAAAHMAAAAAAGAAAAPHHTVGLGQLAAGAVPQQGAWQQQQQGGWQAATAAGGVNWYDDAVMHAVTQ